LNIKYNIYSLFLLIVISFVPAMLKAQVPATPPNPEVNKDRVNVDYSDRLEYFSKNGTVYQKLVGNVRMHQNTAFMYCDSALLDQTTNVLRAYSKVILQQSDTVSIFADSMIYNGISRIADLYDKTDVVLVSGKTQLFSNKTLHYDLNTKIASYTKGAYIKNKETQISSRIGEYYVASHEVLFKRNVVVLDKDLTVRTDTLQYNTDDRTAVFLAPTRIDQDKSKLYCERGYYDFQAKKAEFINNPQFEKGTQKAAADTIKYDGILKEFILINEAYIVDTNSIAKAKIIRYNEQTDITTLSGDAFYKSKKQQITGDSVSFNNKTQSFKTQGRSKIVDGAQELEGDKVDFDKVSGVGVARGNVYWRDTAQRTSIKCIAMTYDKKKDYIKTLGGRPLLISEIDKDTLFMVADTFVSFRDSIRAVLGKDTARTILAYHDVRIYKSDLQAVCDSLTYSGTDSLFRFFKKPLMWSDSTQFSGDTINIQLVKGKIDRIKMLNNALIINDETSDLYDQIKGKNITSFFVNGKMNKMQVLGNAESVYYAKDDAKAFIGVNKVQCSSMLINWGEKEVLGIHFYTQPQGVLTPMRQVKPELMRLQGFNWSPKRQPHSVKDLF
jgi:lipopolysaccharide export system protein LptA